MTPQTFKSPFVEALHYCLNLNEMPSVELNVRLNITTDEFSELVQGERPLTNDLAQRLEHIFEVSSDTWMKLNQVSNNVHSIQTV